MPTAFHKKYIWQQPAWPNFTIDWAAVGPALLKARQVQALLEGKAKALGLDQTNEMACSVLADEVMATAAIEGERLDPEAVRSSVLRQLGYPSVGSNKPPINGLVELINDAVRHHDKPLTHDRLWRWQAALFPTGMSGLHQITVGRYRDHPQAMQIVSGKLGRPETVHFEGPPSSRMLTEMTAFIDWFDQTTPGPSQKITMDGVARAAMAHVWFETIHPFEDGNGRIGRAIVDMALAQDQAEPFHLYSLSSELLISRTAYYDALNEVQIGDGDITTWVMWFAQQFAAACHRSNLLIDRAIEKSRFWLNPAALEINQRQRKVLQRLLDAGDGNFTGGLNAQKYMSLTHTSKATATRDLADLTARQLLWTVGQAKGIRYYINVPGWTHHLQAEGWNGGS